MFFIKSGIIRGGMFWGEDFQLSFGFIVLEVFLRYLSRDIEEEIVYKGYI